MQGKIDIENIEFDSDDNDDDNYILKDYDDNMKQKLPKNYLKNTLNKLILLYMIFKNILELIGKGKLLKFSRLKLRIQMNIEQ